MRKQQLVTAGVLGSVALVVAGCASFRGGKLAPIEQWPPAASNKKSVRLVVSFDNTFNGSPMEGAGQVLDNIAGETEKMYVESGLFSEVRRSSDSTDLVADIKIKRSEDGSIGMAILTGLTLYLIPSKADVTLALHTRFRDAEGNDLGTIEKTEVITTWQQMFLFPVMFAKYPIPVFWRTFDDLHRATLLEAHARGLI